MESKDNLSDLEEPDQSDCCNSGCNPCILDLYVERKRKLQKKSVVLQNKTDFLNCLQEFSYSIFKLVLIAADSLNCNLYTFEYCRYLRNEAKLDSKILKIVFKPGQHLLLKNDFQQFTRAYTPIPNKNNSDLQFTVLVKLYEYGKMSKYLKNLQIGQETLWRGPYGNVVLNYDFSNILLIAQGVGISPLYAILKEMLENEECDIIFKLFYACRSIREISLHSEIYDLSSYWNFTYEIFLSDSQNCNGKYNELIHSNKLSEIYVGKFLDGKLDCDKNMLILICGSDMFMNFYRDKIIDFGVNKEHVVLF